MSEHKIYHDKALLPVQENSCYAIAAARFNHEIVDQLLQGAVTVFKRHGIEGDRLTVVHVPGAFELPLVCQKLAQTQRYQALVGLGCIIRGDTPHFDYVCSESSHGLLEVSLKYTIPVIYGVLTTDTLAQAQARAKPSLDGNKGVDAAFSAIEMVNALSSI